MLAIMTMEKYDSLLTEKTSSRVKLQGQTSATITSSVKWKRGGAHGNNDNATQPVGEDGQS